MVLRSVELNLADRFLYACMPWFTSSSVEHGDNFFGNFDNFFGNLVIF